MAGYIGNFPTALPLTSSDLPDDIVTSAKIADGTITATDTDGSIGKPAFKNLIINGDMSIAQRGTSVSSVTTTGYRTCDRFQPVMSSAGTWTISQSTDVPTGEGFATSFKMDCTTADASLSASDYLIVRTLLEGQNLQKLKFGTSSAESLTLSFWVRSNKTGIYAVWFYADVGNKSFSKTYTIDSADTWEKKTITINGDTASSFSNNNSIGLRINWYLASGTTYTSGTLPTDWQTDSNGDRAVGQVNLADNTANEWYITGVQLEVGTSASDFEFLPYDLNLDRCERYYQILAGMVGQHNGTDSHLAISFRKQMRAQGTLSCPSNTIGFTDGYAGQYTTTTANPSWTSSYYNYGGRVQIFNLPSLTGDARRGTMIHNIGSGLIIDSEL
jgi:hypothetical protein